MAACLGNSCKIDNAVTDLPDPLSPTIAVIFPFVTVKDISFKANVDMPSSKKLMFRSFISSRGNIYAFENLEI